MSPNFEAAHEFVRQRFQDHPELAREYGYRDKYQHTLRVLAWMRRLLLSEEADADIALWAALFHDIGYTVSREDHPRYGAEICAAYLTQNQTDAVFAARVAECVRDHGKKELLHAGGTSKELILLIEADCLDESGAMSVLRDALSEGGSASPDYGKTYRRLLKRRLFLQPGEFRCATETARKIWLEKQRLYLDIVESLRVDLGGL